MDAKDILGLPKNSFPPLEKKSRPQKESHQRKPDGISREVYALTGGLAALMPAVDSSQLKKRPTSDEKKQSSDATRTEPEFLDSNGQAFWKLQSYNGEYAVLLQDIKIQDAAATKVDERWFVYGPEKKQEIDKYITSRAKRPKIHKVSYILSNESSEADM